MTAQEIKAIDDLCERKYKALLNVERVTGVNSMQSVVARAEWWGACDIANYMHEKFYDHNVAKPREDKKH